MAVSVILSGMKYETLKPLSDKAFKRLVGIHWSTFQAMVEVLKQGAATKGRPRKLSVEDQLLMSLSYWREYRTLFHLAMDYGISEPSASRILRAVEDRLIGSGLFSLPKKLPQGEGMDWDVVVVDATEVAIDRPQKNSVATTAVNIKPTP